MNCWRYSFANVPPHESTNEICEADFCPTCGWLLHQCACVAITQQINQAKLLLPAAKDVEVEDERR